MPLGIVGSNVSPQAFLKYRRETIELPLAADVDYFSSSVAAAGAQAAMDISASTAGTAVLLSAIAQAAPVRYGRLPTISTVDASGTSLSVTVRLVGRRFGRQVVQTITSTSTGTVAGTTVIDELTSATIVAIANNTTSDTLSIGFDGTRFGLMAPVRSVKSVKFLEKIVAGAPDANAGATAGAAGAIATTGSIRAGAVLQVSTVVFTADSSLNLAALYNNVAVAATDRFVIEYVADGADEFNARGKKYA